MTGTEPTGIEATGVQGDDPPGPQRWRSAPAAALLNLTGLGLGYLYLGHRWRAVVAAAVTVVLVVVAFATDAASTPCCGRRWPRPCSSGWPSTVGGSLTGSPGPSWSPTGPPAAGPVAVALAAMAAVFGAYLGYGERAALCTPTPVPHGPGATARPSADSTSSPGPSS